MKKAIIGGFISITGSIGNLSILIVAANNMIGGWSTPPGRLLSTVSEIGMTPLMIFSCILVVIGLIIMGVEFFKREG